MILHLIVLLCLVSFSQGGCSLPEGQAREHRSEGVREEMVNARREIEEVRRRSEERRAEFVRQQAEFALRRAEIARQEAEIAERDRERERMLETARQARAALEIEVGREAVARLLEAFHRGENVEAIVGQLIGDVERARI